MRALVVLRGVSWCPLVMVVACATSSPAPATTAARPEPRAQHSAEVPVVAPPMRRDPKNSSGRL